MPERIEAERLKATSDERPAPVYAPGEPKLTMAKCLILATSKTAGKQITDITPDVVMAWTADAVDHRMTPEEIKWAFRSVIGSSDFFPTWHKILAAVKDHRSYTSRIGSPPEPKALPEPVSADQRKALTAKMDALTVGVNMNRSEDRKRTKREPVIITDAQRAEGQRQIERLRG